MKAIKVNADYESVLFTQKSQPKVNEALEFLALYLDPRPLLSSKSYQPEFLKHVENLVGHEPVIVKEGPYENWWGDLKDLELERKMNSKVMSTKLSIKNKWCRESQVLSSLEDLPKLDKVFLAKSPYGMSGLNFSLVSESRLKNLEVMLAKGNVILEPLLERVSDFSHFVFPNGVSICYQNIVDKKYQYRGTLFQNYTEPTVENLPFYSQINPSEWEKFNDALHVIKEAYQTDITSGFSIDSFTYKDNCDLKIRYLSEVNCRRTMGRVAFELSLKFGGLRKWSLFILSKSSGLSFSEIKEKISPITWKENLSRGVVLLSPGEVRYDMFFLSAMNAEEGRLLLDDLKKLLPDSEFAVEL